MRIASRILRLAAPLLLFACGCAQAQKEVGRMIVGYPPGQSVDVVARLLADRLGPVLGRTLVVENMPGQAGSVALAAFARMPADGSTLTLSAAAALAGNPALYSKIRYDSVRDFEPIGLVYDAPLVLMVHAKVPAETFRELVAYVKAHPGAINYSSPGNGSVSHLAMTELMRRTGINMTHVPYVGAAKSLTDLAAGEVQVSFDAYAAAQPFLAGGKVRAIAVSSAERVSTLPSIPTLSESGLEGFDLVPWVGLLAPAGTPAPTVEKLSQELAKIVRSPEFSQRIVTLGGRPRSSSAEQFRAFMRSEVTRWAAVIKESGARLD
jgi:tripartite-type tricarboxylate transporter receptor subunit TctC